MPSLDLRFADSKSLVDTVTGQSLVTFTRASNGTYVDSTGTLQTASTDVPRFDHNPTTGESLGLLVEEARTNLLLNSATLSTQSVTVSAAAHTLSFTGTGTITLSGTSTAGPLVGTGTGEASRVSLTFTPTAGTLTLTVSGTVSNAQLELGSFRTSYIPTTSATATRSADVASITGSNFSGWYNQSNGTIFADYGISALAIGTITSFDDGTFNNRWQQRFTLTGTRYRLMTAGVSLVDDVDTSIVPATNVSNKVAFALANGDQRFSGNGILSNFVRTISSLPTVTQMQVGQGPGSDTSGRIIIRRLCYWPARLPNTTLQALTQ